MNFGEILKAIQGGREAIEAIRDEVSALLAEVKGIREDIRMAHQCPDSKKD